MSINHLLTNIEHHIRSKNLVAPKSIFIHAGKFTWSELKRRGFSAPALFISCLGFRSADFDDEVFFQSYEHVIKASLVIGIVTKHAKGSEARNAQARTLAEQITLILKDQRWGMNNAGCAEKIKADGIFSAPAEEENCSLWLVNFQQLLGINSDDWQQSLNDFLSAYGDTTTTDGANIKSTTTLPKSA